MQVRLQRNAVFVDSWHTRCRYVCLKGGAGSGKSVDTAQLYIVRLLTEAGRNLLCVRKIESAHRNSTFSELRSAIERLGVGSLFTVTASPMRIQCNLNGNEIIFGGIYDQAQREKLKSITALSGSLTDIWIEEATELESSDLDILDDRLRGRLPEGLFYQIRMTFNPVSANHWIKRRFFDREDENVYCHHSTYLDNYFCDAEYLVRMERRKRDDAEGYRVYALGEWGEHGGLILPNFYIKEFDTAPEIFDDFRIGQDFGYNHANVILCVGLRDGEVYVCSELYLHGMTTDEIILRSEGIPKNIPMLCDSAEPDRITMWCRAGFRARPVIKYSGSVGFGIDWLKRRKIYIHPSCVGTIAEISAWSWQRDSDGSYTDIPQVGADDAMAALRYACGDWVQRDRQLARKQSLVEAAPGFFSKRYADGLSGKIEII